MTELGWPLWTDLDLTPIALAGLAGATWIAIRLRRKLARNRKTRLTLAMLDTLGFAKDKEA